MPRIWGQVKPEYIIICCSLSELCPAPCSPMDCSMRGFPVLHCLLESAQIHVHWVSQWCHPTISFSVAPCSSALKFSQHWGIFQWVSSWHQVAKGLKLQLQHQHHDLSPWQNVRNRSHMQDPLARYFLTFFFFFLFSVSSFQINYKIWNFALLKITDLARTSQTIEEIEAQRGRVTVVLTIKMAVTLGPFVRNHNLQWYPSSHGSLWTPVRVFSSVSYWLSWALFPS